MIIRRLFVVLVLLCAVVVSAQEKASIRDLRLQESGSTKTRHRSAGDGVIRGYNAAGAQTSSWDSGTGKFSGVFAGQLPGWVIVDAAGRGDYTSIGTAEAAIRAQTGVGNATTTHIAVMPGIYTECVDVGTTNLQIIGLTRDACIVTSDTDSPSSETSGTVSAVMNILASGVRIENLTLWNTDVWDGDMGTAKALKVGPEYGARGWAPITRFVAKDCLFIGQRDTVGVAQVDASGVVLEDCVTSAGPRNGFDAAYTFSDLTLRRSLVLSESVPGASAVLWTGPNGARLRMEDSTIESTGVQYGVLSSDATSRIELEDVRFCGDVLYPVYATGGAMPAVDMRGVWLAEPQRASASTDVYPAPRPLAVGFGTWGGSYNYMNPRDVNDGTSFTIEQNIDTGLSAAATAKVLRLIVTGSWGSAAGANGTILELVNAVTNGSGGAALNKINGLIVRMVNGGSMGLSVVDNVTTTFQVRRDGTVDTSQSVNALRDVAAGRDVTASRNVVAGAGFSGTTMTLSGAAHVVGDLSSTGTIHGEMGAFYDRLIIPDGYPGSTTPNCQLSFDSAGPWLYVTYGGTRYRVGLESEP